MTDKKKPTRQNSPPKKRGGSRENMDAYEPRRTFRMPDEHWEWLKAHGSGSASRGLRRLLTETIANEARSETQKGIPRDEYHEVKKKREKKTERLAPVIKHEF